ncbi:MAG: hypothetical protein ACOY4I_02580 [Bacillota bacterium]
MARFKKILTLLICTVFILSFTAGPVLAKGKGGGGRSGGFSSGGRSSFSSGAKGYSTSGGSYSSPARESQSGSAPAGGAPVGAAGSGASPGSGSSSRSGAESTVGGGTGSYGKGYSTETGSFSTPRQNSPPTLYSDYKTGREGFSTGKDSYSTGMGSYSGSWNRDSYASTGMDKYPSRPPVGVFGSPPAPPYKYHNDYWSLPFLARMFFQPNFYWTPWGYHYYAPRLITWIIATVVIVAVIIIIRNRLRGPAGM